MIIFATMKQAIAFIMALVMGLPDLLNVSAVANYMVQYRYYVEVLCVNADRPEMQCNGTCQLAQELQQSEEKPQAPGLPEMLVAMVSPAVLPQSTIVPFMAVPKLVMAVPLQEWMIPADEAGDVFNPPERAA